MKYDQFEIKAVLKESGAKDSSPESFYMVIKIFINGKDLSGDDWIDPETLERSLTTRDDYNDFKSGSFGKTESHYIVTCSCGIHECGGFYTGIKVTHFDDCVLWQLPIPLCFTRDWSSEEREWHESSPDSWRYDAYRFERNAFIQAAEKAIAEVKSYRNLQAKTEKNH